MKNKKEVHNEYFSIDVWEQWTQFFDMKNCNWIDFHFVKAYVDVSRHTGTAEVELCLLGFGMRIYWVYSKKVFDKKMKEWAKAMKNKHEWVEL